MAVWMTIVRKSLWKLEKHFACNVTRFFFRPFFLFLFLLFFSCCAHLTIVFYFYQMNKARNNSLDSLSPSHCTNTLNVHNKVTVFFFGISFCSSEIGIFFLYRYCFRCCCDFSVWELLGYIFKMMPIIHSSCGS